MKVAIELGAPGRSSRVKFHFSRERDSEERLLVTAKNLTGLSSDHDAQPVRGNNNRSGQLAGWYETSDNSREFWVGKILGVGEKSAEFSLLVQGLLKHDPENKNFFRLLFVPVNTDLSSIASKSRMISFATIKSIQARIPPGYTILDSKVRG